MGSKKRQYFLSPLYKIVREEKALVRFDGFTDLVDFLWSNRRSLERI